MSTLPALLDWLKEDRDLLQENLTRLGGGLLTTANEREGRMVDTTKETALDYRQRLVRIAALIEAVERDLAQGT